MKKTEEKDGSSNSTLIIMHVKKLIKNILFYLISKGINTIFSGIFAMYAAPEYVDELFS